MLVKRHNNKAILVPMKKRHYNKAILVPIATRAYSGTVPELQICSVGTLWMYSVSKYAACLRHLFTALRRGLHRCRWICYCRGLVGQSDQNDPIHLNLSCLTPVLFCPVLFFLLFFLWCDFFLIGSHHSPSVSTIFLPPSKFHAPILELLSLMSGQCTNPGPPYPSPV